MAYDAYRDLPADLRPTFADAVVLTEIVRLIKEAVRIRHDFHTAIHRADSLASIRQAFVPAIIREERPAERHLGAPPAWESAFSELQGNNPSLAALAERHHELSDEARTRAGRLSGNAKLAGLVKQQLAAFFPDIGYSASSGDFLRRLRKDERSVLQAFHPLGVGDVALLIRMLHKRRFSEYYYW